MGCVLLFLHALDSLTPDGDVGVSGGPGRSLPAVPAALHGASVPAAVAGRHSADEEGPVGEGGLPLVGREGLAWNRQKKKP